MPRRSASALHWSVLKSQALYTSAAGILEAWMRQGGAPKALDRIKGLHPGQARHVSLL